MELRQYWRIIRRRIWIPSLLLIVVAAVSLLTTKTPPPTYTASMKFIIGVEPERLLDQFNYDGYYAGISSEFIADDLSAVIGSQAFIEDINRHLAEMGSGVQLSPGAVSGLTFGDRQHRVLQVTLSWPDPAELQAIGEAVVQAIEADSPKYIAQFNSYDSQVIVLDRPLIPVPIPVSLTQRLDLPIRLILALVAGVGLIFLLDYLDTSVRAGGELEQMGIPVLAEVPKQK
jgi:capsular polysaccharide biosynthesis protein